MPADTLSFADLERNLPKASLTRGRDYVSGRRVRKLWLSYDRTEITSEVHGSDYSPYAVSIVLTRTPGLIDISGDCTCPVGYNCKHVAATLLKVLDDGLMGAQPGTPTPIATMPYEITAWLEKLSEVERGNDYPPQINQRLLYVLQPETRTPRMPQVVVSTLSVRVLKDGSLSGNTTRSNFSNFNPESAPKYYRDNDVAIASQLARLANGYGEMIVRRAGLLREIVATGRAYWTSHNGQPLAWGDERPGQITWTQRDKSGMLPMLEVEGAVACNAEAPVYIDPVARLVGDIATGLSPRLAFRLLSAPPISRGMVDQVTRNLATRLPQAHHDLLPGRPAVAIDIRDVPVPILRLEMSKSAPYAYYNRVESVAVARLTWRYGLATIEPSEKAARTEVFIDGKLHVVHRDERRERAFVRQLTIMGFEDLRRSHYHLADAGRQDYSLETVNDWLAFLHSQLPQLQAQGCEIHIDAAFPYRLTQASGTFDAEFQSSGIDWFELDLGIDIDGQRYDLAPVLAALVMSPGFKTGEIETLAAEGDDFFLALGDGRHLAVAAERFLPVVLALHALNLNGLLASGASGIKVSRADMAGLLDFESANFTFKGVDNLRRLAGLLKANGLPPLCPPEGFLATLRPYQAQGLAWLDLLRDSGLGGILADDMGLGKTVQILALLAREKAEGRQILPSLIVAPTSLMTNWCQEAARFAPDLKVLLLHGSARKQDFAAISAHDVVLTTYPLIARDHEVLLEQDWHVAVLDEAQTIKNPAAATTKWLRGVKAQHRFCLTGTPMENHLGELWSLMSFVNPGFLGEKAAFTRAWRTPIEKLGDKVRAQALARRVKPFLLRRTKSEVVDELPPKIEIVETVVLDDRQRDLYDSIRLSMSEKVRQAIADRGLAKSHIIVLEALLKMRQVCCDPRLLKLTEKTQRPSAKLERLMEMVVELQSEGRKIIVFSQFTSMLALIQARCDTAGLSYSLLTGDTKDRKSAIEAFQKGKRDIFLISLKAGGVGLNLTAADTVILYDPWWNPAVEAQAVDRAHRIGQDKPVFVYRLVTSGTIEEKMSELKARKQALADSLFDQDGGIGKALTEDDVAALFEA